MLVYVILNTANGKKYVGQTQHTLDKRWAQHRYNASHPSASAYDTYFYRAIRKYGADAFLPITLREVSTKEELDQEERRFIALYQSHKPYAGYNGTLGGDGGIPNEQTREKIRASNVQHFSTPEMRARQGTHRKGTKLSEKHKAAISAANRGRVASDETRKRMSEAQTGHAVSDAQKKLISERNLAAWANPEYRQHMSDVHKGKNTGPRPPEVGQRISAVAKSKLRGKETELKIVRCLGGLPYYQIADLYGVCKKAVMNVCKDLAGNSRDPRKSYGAPTVTTKEELISLGLIANTPDTAPVAPFQLPEEDQPTCNLEL